MDSGYYAACSALKAQSNALEIVANNIANVSTVGYSAAQLDKRRAGKLATAIQTAFQQYGSLPPKPAEVGGLAEHGIPSLLPVVKLSRTTSTCCANRWKTRYQEKLPVEKSPRTSLNEGLMISLREVGFFDSGSADIRPSSRPAFDRLAAVLQGANTDLRIEGHTDNVPIRNARFASNWDLSTARATETVRLLMSKYNFAPERLAASGYAEYRPIASNDTADGRAMNRRVDIVVPRKQRPT